MFETHAGTNAIDVCGTERRLRTTSVSGITTLFTRTVAIRGTCTRFGGHAGGRFTRAASTAICITHTHSSCTAPIVPANVNARARVRISGVTTRHTRHFFADATGKTAVICAARGSFVTLASVADQASSALVIGFASGGIRAGTIDAALIVTALATVGTLNRSVAASTFSTSGAFTTITVACTRVGARPHIAVSVTIAVSVAFAIWSLNARALGGITPFTTITIVVGYTFTIRCSF